MDFISFFIFCIIFFSLVLISKKRFGKDIGFESREECELGLDGLSKAKDYRRNFNDLLLLYSMVYLFYSYAWRPNKDTVGFIGY